MLKYSLLFAVLCSALLASAVYRLPKYEVETYYNVAILQKIGPNEWWLLREDGLFRYHGCDDFDNNSVIGVGYVATRLKYLQTNTCESIRGETLGFFYDNPPKEIYPGSGEKRKEWGDKIP